MVVCVCVLNDMMCHDVCIDDNTESGEELRGDRPHAACQEAQRKRDDADHACRHVSTIWRSIKSQFISSRLKAGAEQDRSTLVQPSNCVLWTMPSWHNAVSMPAFQYRTESPGETRETTKRLEVSNGPNPPRNTITIGRKG